MFGHWIFLALSYFSFNYITQLFFLGFTRKIGHKRMGLVRNILWIEMFVRRTVFSAGRATGRGSVACSYCSSPFGCQEGDRATEPGVDCG